MGNDNDFKHNTKDSFSYMEIASLREDLRQFRADLRQDLYQIRAESNQRIDSLTEEIQKISEQRSSDMLNLSVQVEQIKTKYKVSAAMMATIVSIGISLFCAWISK